MFDYTVAKLFGDMVAKYGAAPALLLVALLASLFRLFQWLGVRIEQMRTEANERREDLKYERDRADKATARLELIVTNHLAHDAEDRANVLAGLGVMTKTMEGINEELKKHREEEARRSGEMHKEFQALNLRIAEKG